MAELQTADEASMGPPGLPSWPPPPPPPPPPLPPTLYPTHPLPPRPAPPMPPQFAAAPPVFRPMPGPGFHLGLAPQHPHFFNPPWPPLPPGNALGPFGPRRPPPLPPPLGQSQIAPGMISPMQNLGGQVGRTVVGQGEVASARIVSRPADGVANSNELRRSTAIERAGQDDSGSSDRDPVINVVEKEILQLQRNKVDVKDLLAQIRSLVVQAEDTVQKVGKAIMWDPSVPEAQLTTCPYDASHRVPPAALFPHFLNCPSNPKPSVDAGNLVSSLSYPRTASRDCDGGHAVQDKPPRMQCRVLDDVKSPSSVDPVSLGRAEAQEESETSSASSEIDIWGGRFFYKDCPAVVQSPLTTLYPEMRPKIGAQLQLTNALDQLQTKVDGTDAAKTSEEGGGSGGVKEGREDSSHPLLPSRLWFLRREVEAWKALPSRCSSLVLQAATGLGRLRREVVSDWLLLQCPAHGILIDSAMASHILTLAAVSLMFLQQEALQSMTHQCDSSERSGNEVVSVDELGPAPNGGQPCHGEAQDVDTTGIKDLSWGNAKIPQARNRTFSINFLDCPHLNRSGQWLSSHLSCLFGPSQSAGLVLKLLKHSLISSGQALASSFVDAFRKQPSWTSPESDRKTTDLNARGDFHNGNRIANRLVDGCVGVSSSELEAAIAAVHERSVLENFLRTLSHPGRSSRSQIIQSHEATVMMAAVERPKRANYRAVLEHDGLIWHRYQLEDKDKKKSREEILAEERDYKRRRMSYRGKKAKRNPTEILHDIIDGHMEEIQRAGGIGCLTKQTPNFLPDEGANGQKTGRSALLSVDDDVRTKWHHANLPPVPRGPSMNSSERRHQSTLNDHHSVRHDQKSHDHDQPRTVSDSDAGSQRLRYPRKEYSSADEDWKERSGDKSDGPRHRSPMPISYHKSDRHHKDEHSPLGRTMRNHDREYEDRWDDTNTTGNSSHHSRSHTADRYRSHSQRYIQRWESLEKHEEGFERELSSERKSSGRHY